MPIQNSKEVQKQRFATVRNTCENRSRIEGRKKGIGVGRVTGQMVSKRLDCTETAIDQGDWHQFGFETVLLYKCDLRLTYCAMNIDWTSMVG